MFKGTRVLSKILRMVFAPPHPKTGVGCVCVYVWLCGLMRAGGIAPLLAQRISTSEFDCFRVGFDTTVRKETIREIVL